MIINLRFSSVEFHLGTVCLQCRLQNWYSGTIYFKMQKRGILFECSISTTQSNVSLYSENTTCSVISSKAIRGRQKLYLSLSPLRVPAFPLPHFYWSSSRLVDHSEFGRWWIHKKPTRCDSRLVSMKVRSL